jgi:hypothetical protein
MKKIFFAIILLLSVMDFVGQDYTILHDRYWYYRTRLRNDFMKVGLSKGCSIPMEERGDGYDPYNGTGAGPFVFTTDNSSGEAAKWGDAMSELGYYIGILAMEHYLLDLNHQETDSVRYELYCALQALNRMDYYAEPYFTHALANSTNPQTFGASLDGFMLRDDVPIDFVQNNMESFNYFENKGFCSKVKINRISTTSGDGAQMQGEDNDGHKNYAGSYISQDNWYPCVVGLALVRKFLQDGSGGETYRNWGFMDGETNISKEALNISKRVLNYFKHNANWALDYPSGNNIGGNDGGTTALFAFAHAKALNKMDKHEWGYYCYPDALTFNNTCQFSGWLTGGNAIEDWFHSNVIFPFLVMLYPFTPHVTSTDFHNAYTLMPNIMLINSGEIEWKAQLQILAGSVDVDVMSANMAAVCNCDYNLIGNTTKGSMVGHVHHHNYNLWHADLLRMVLHGYEDCSSVEFSQSSYDNSINMLGLADCSPHHWNNDPNPSNYEWETQTRLEHPNSRGGGGWIAEYNGIDYMFYHNLINIIDIQKNGLTGPKLVVDFGRRHIKTNYPANINGNMWGSPSYPAVVKAFEYIVADAGSVAANSNVSFWAGKEVTIGPGFSIDNPNDVAIGIQHFECGEIMSNPINPSVNARNGNPNQNVDPGLMATSYVKTDELNNTIVTEEDQHHNPTLVHVDSLMTQNQKTLSTSLIAEIAPNPNAGFSKLFLTKPDLVKSIDVLDPLAKLLFSLNTVSFSNDIDLSNLSKGVFSIVIKGVEGDVIVKKVVVQ